MGIKNPLMSIYNHKTGRIGVIYKTVKCKHSSGKTSKNCNEGIKAKLIRAMGYDDC